jgi:hypothetical protein
MVDSEERLPHTAIELQAKVIHYARALGERVADQSFVADLKNSPAVNHLRAKREVVSSTDQR